MARKSIPRTLVLVALSSAAAIASCSSSPSNTKTSSTTSSGGSSGSGASGGSGTGGGPSTFQADPPAVYVAKVKNILIGKAPTDAEVQAVVNDTAPPVALEGLIATWMQDPAYDDKMRVFFTNAFQQTQINASSFTDMMLPNGIGPGEGIPLLIQNMTESFARTIIAENKAGQPLTDAMTTNQIMMTGPLMELYTYLDEVVFDDSSLQKDPYSTDYLPTELPNLTDIYQGDASYQNIPLTDSVDPTSTNFMHFYTPGVATLTYMSNGAMDPACSGASGNDPIDYPVAHPATYKQNPSSPASYILQWIMYGAVYNHQAASATQMNPHNCGSRALKGTMWWNASDFGESAWRMVTITPGKPATHFFEVPTFQMTSTNTLSLRTPRLGYFSTPAFFANWSTNASNQMRVTLNQSLIVATGHSITDDMTKLPQPAGTPPPGLDQAHMTQPACEGCHQYLDPARVILSASWSYPYYAQLDPAQQSAKGQFVFQGVVNQSINTLNDFATALAQHPDTPAAWVQKLCYYVNSSPATTANPNGGCDENDPEFKRIVTDFKNNGMKWDAMVTDLLSSPLTTNAKPTVTTDEVEIVAVSRRDHLCAALNNRLFGGPASGADICGLEVSSPASTIQEVVAGFPADGYGRGSPIPVLPTLPNLFYRGGIEAVCESVATMLIDNSTPPAGAMTWKSSAGPNGPIADFVSIVMAIEPSDPRYAPAQAALLDHYNAAAATQGVSASTALQSTFTVACMSPSFVGVGM